MQYVFFALLFALLVAVFAIQNYILVTISFLFWQFQTSLVIVILGSATIGAVIVLLLSLLMQFRMQCSLNKEKQKSFALNVENDTLKKRIREQNTNNMTKNEG